MWKKIVLSAITLFAISLAAPALAQSVVNQGQGQSTSGRPWAVQGSATGVAISVTDTANAGAKNSEVCMSNLAGGTTITAYAGRRAIVLQNLGPNPIYCTIDGQAPTTSLGFRIVTGSAWELDVGPAISVRCIAATAAQSTGACTQVVELK